ncbi:MULTISPECIES: hypothetical protein [Parabacteroides]|uniref:hypothetical protein n=1 Tax=Parabacteroides TaxID=375288 RepID=UPI002030290C|nr:MULTISPECIES: hypothetical protein [unclassified Parabacteroides]MCM0712672.1 hypothetical protein [Parabacteroides sp. TA-V-105]
MKTTVCTCSFCRKGEYDPSEYMVDIAGFAKERPVGVSGLMRVKNEARWVAQSIDTCIDALDELIICYQSCSDETPWIIEQKRRQYPDKIKVFFYAPPVFSHDLSEEEYGYACSLPEDSIHLLSNYYNYTLSKATYRYAMKIDADQIYFPERMIRLCDAYRSLPVKRKTISACLAFGYYRLFLSLSRRCPRFFFKTLDFLPFGNIVMEKYETYLYVQISQTKQPVALSGINLYKEKEEWKIPAYAECHEYMLSFNGNGDLVVFAISDKSYYTPFARPVDLKNFLSG